MFMLLAIATLSLGCFRCWSCGDKINCGVKILWISAASPSASAGENFGHTEFLACVRVCVGLGAITDFELMMPCANVLEWRKRVVAVVHWNEVRRGLSHVLCR
eukprot:TRINITY_DN5706_c0_g1_i1.p1 TRINITY_DN5706_c0_g1~~TRINITY_DN5706_c0_g1_i1.p1  ORF type:complete len:103 (-),score=9.59 TRINITY_DN5706_c0_g1_i1:45-353(-)